MYLQSEKLIQNIKKMSDACKEGKAGIPYMFYSYCHYQSLLLIFFSPRKFSLHGTLSFPPLIHSVSLSLPDRTSDQGAPLNPPRFPVGQKSPKSSSWRWKHFRSLSAPEVQIQILCLHPGSPEGCVGFSRCEHPIPCDSPFPSPLPLPSPVSFTLCLNLRELLLC